MMEYNFLEVTERKLIIKVRGMIIWMASFGHFFWEFY